MISSKEIVDYTNILLTMILHSDTSIMNERMNEYKEDM